MQTKIDYGWIRTGKEKAILTTASRTRVNITGAINLTNMDVIHTLCETVNGESLIHFFEVIKAKYPHAPLIHIMLDNAGYYQNAIFQEMAEKNGFKLHFLPPYSPNLNPIERLWKIMNEEARNNKYFSKPKEFKEAIRNFFTETMPKITDKLKTRITDNFRVLDAASSF
jgi:transposase